MSRFLTQKLNGLTPYTPGEQISDRKYIKLNTNESPFPPSETALRLSREQAEKLMLYPDPDCKELTALIADECGVDGNNVIVTNGSDEVLNFAFMAFCDEKTPAVFPDITYGFYKVFAELYNIDYEEVPLKDGFRLDVNDYISRKGTLFIANPNAPTGIALAVSEIEKIIKSNKNRVVVIDEAYVDFGAESCIPLVKKYDNLLVTQTFSKSRSLAGARLGFGVASEAIINDLTRVKYSTNPYNVNRMTAAAGIGALKDKEYFNSNVNKIIKNREYASERLRQMGFKTTESKANFIFATSADISGKELYLRLKERGVLVRHFDKNKISGYNRITVGSIEEMQILLKHTKNILEELK